MKRITVTATDIQADDDSHLEIVHSIALELPMNKNLRVDLKKETEKDKNYQQIMNYIKTGWPKHIGQLPEALMPYFRVRNELFSEDGIIYLNEDGNIRIVVPPALRVPVLNLIHKGHMGMDKSKSRASEAFFWPKILDHVELVVKRCITCSKFQPKNMKLPLHPHELPTRRWQRISMDIATHAGKDFLVTYDSYSKWLEINQLASKSAEAVIDVCKTLFATHGRPETIISDNNPFASFSFKKFAKELDIELITSSPNFPQSNGRAEKGVSIAKMMLRKAAETRTDVRDYLLEYRNTKIPAMDHSPAQLMFACKLKASLPISDKSLQPQVPKEVTEKLRKQQERTRAWYDKTARGKERKFIVGEKVRVENTCGRKTEWSTGEITGICNEPRSYMVKTNGSTLRRTVTQLRPQNSNIEEIDYYDIPSARLNESKEVVTSSNLETPQEEQVPQPKSQNGDEQRFESTYQLIVPHWLYNTSYVTRAGRFVRNVK